MLVTDLVCISTIITLAASAPIDRHHEVGRAGPSAQVESRQTDPISTEDALRYSLPWRRSRSSSTPNARDVLGPRARSERDLVSRENDDSGEVPRPEDGSDPSAPWKRDDFENPVQPWRRDRFEEPIQPWKRGDFESPTAPWKKDSFEEPTQPWKRDEFESPTAPWRRDKFEEPTQPWKKDRFEDPTAPWKRDDFENPTAPWKRDDGDEPVSPEQATKGSLPWRFRRGAFKRGAFNIEKRNQDAQSAQGNQAQPFNPEKGMDGPLPWYKRTAGAESHSSQSPRDDEPINPESGMTGPLPWYDYSDEDTTPDDYTSPPPASDINDVTGRELKGRQEEYPYDQVTFTNPFPPSFCSGSGYTFNFVGGSGHYNLQATYVWPNQQETHPAYVMWNETENYYVFNLDMAEKMEGATYTFTISDAMASDPTMSSARSPPIPVHGC